MKIAVILPWGARYSPSAQPGAIELSIETILAHSRYLRDTTVISNPPVYEGIVHSPYESCTFLAAIEGQRIRGNRKVWHRALIARLEALQPDIILVEQTALSVPVLKSAFPSIPILLHRHDAQVPVNPLKRWRLHKDICKADFVICNSNYTRLHHVRHCGCKTEKVKTLYNALSFPNQPIAYKKEKLVVCVAGMMPRKGPHIFVEALTLFLTACPDWSAILVSTTSGKAPKRYRAALKESIMKCRKLSYFDSLSHDGVLDLYRRSAIAVVPSQWKEPFGRTALEAILCHSALVSSGRGGLFEVSGEWAQYPQDQTPKAYAEAMIALARNKQLRNKLTQEAYKRAHALFSAQKVRADYDAILKYCSLR